MKKKKSEIQPFHILLADDDKDDRFFFAKALDSLGISTKFTSVSNGELLMEYLNKNAENLPDVLFLDINMPRKKGSECLKEIKADKRLAGLHVIIYSTSLNDEIADKFYRNGAYYYMRKCDFSELIILLEWVLTELMDKYRKLPSREEFIINRAKVNKSHYH